MSWERLAELRADFNPHGIGVLWGPAGRWFAVTPSGGVVVADSPHGLRRQLRVLDSTTDADTQTLRRVDDTARAARHPY